MITLEQVTIAYPGHAEPVVSGITLALEPQETLVLLGGSGAGKSTVLKAILRLVEPAHGRILIDGEDIRFMDRVALRRRIGMVFQGIALFPHLTVAENIALPLRIAGMAPRPIAARVDELLQLVGLDAGRYARSLPHSLSGGQQQRVGVARALGPQPHCLLMDEPFGALDAITRRALQDELKLLRHRLGITILFVTHDVMEAVTLGDRLGVMQDGRLRQCGPVRHLLENPADEAVRDLVSRPLAELETFVHDSVA